MFYWLITATALVSAPGEQLDRFVALQSHMGTKFEIVLYAPSEDHAEKAFRSAFARIAELNQVMSDYEPDSELSKLSRSAPTSEPISISGDLYSVLSVAQKLSERTGGAFDVTVGPLTKLWRRAHRKEEFPAERPLEEARQATGFKNLVLDKRARAASLLKPGMRLDLGGIAKGYAGDEALRALAKLGVRRAIVNAGGDVVAGDAPPGESGWLVAVASLERDAPPSQFLRAANCSVATSGDVWQFVEIDGVRYSHILNPSTGLGLTNRSSVTIVAPNGTAADSLASAVSVLGPKAGLKLVEATERTEALILTPGDAGVRAHASSGWSRLVDDQRSSGK